MRHDAFLIVLQGFNKETHEDVDVKVSHQKDVEA